MLFNRWKSKSFIFIKFSKFKLNKMHNNPKETLYLNNYTKDLRNTFTNYSNNYESNIQQNKEI